MDNKTEKEHTTSSPKSLLAEIISVFGYLVIAFGLAGAFFIATLERDAVEAVGGNHTATFWTTLLIYAFVSILAGLLLMGLAQIIELLTKIEHNTFETAAYAEENAEANKPKKGESK